MECTIHGTRDQEAKRDHDESTDDARELEPPRILLAEDDFEMRRFLAAALRKDGYEVVEASDGVDLLAMLADIPEGPVRRRRFDLIISDHRMPGFTGLEVLEGVQGELWPPPFIMITAFGSDEFDQDSHRAGAAAVFHKPFDVDDLRTVVLWMIGPTPIDRR